MPINWQLSRQGVSPLIYTISNINLVSNPPSASLERYLWQSVEWIWRYQKIIFLIVISVGIYSASLHVWGLLQRWENRPAYRIITFRPTPSTSSSSSLEMIIVVGLREQLTGKKSISFGHCPNYHILEKEKVWGF